MVLVLVAAAGLLWALHDPAWLGSYRHGWHPDGWTGGRASVFLPSGRKDVTFEVAGPDAYTVQVSVFVDGQLVDRFSVDDTWRPVTVRLDGLPTTRRHRRLDLHVARAWGEHRKGIRVKGL